MAREHISKVVLAYSGGLDTSAIVPWLKEHYGGCEVVAFAANVGQDPGDLKGIEDKAVRAGASSCHVVDLREAFLREFVIPSLAAGVVYEHRYLLGTSMARPIIARAQVEVARQVGADAVSHGCTGKGNDQVRFEHAFAALAPDLRVIAPWREWDFRSREELLNYVHAKGVAVSASHEKLWSRDGNLWHLSHEGGVLEDPWTPAPDDVWVLTSGPEEAPDEPEDVELRFERGAPVKLNGERKGLVELVEKLNEIAARHGVGRLDVVESRVVGMKSRGCYETPGGAVIVEALNALEELTLDREMRRFRAEIALKHAHLVYEGRWFTPLREALHAAAAVFASRLTGDVIVRLYKGSATARQRSADVSLYSEDFATFGADDVYNQKHAEGYIRLFSLPEQIAALNDQARARKALSPSEVIAEPEQHA
jgi:argininosuccinate synthase